jgi:hypothetical protein
LSSRTALASISSKLIDKERLRGRPGSRQLIRKSFLIALGLILALAFARGWPVLALEGQIRLEETELVLRLEDGCVLR